ncbi:hypothetical protein ACODT3_39450 [Streptomyces sp. 4.24]|uniref:hypothetical protein n=1 Tax=Streptomyces tritrimontium TaxID=3406573 RepID=UPI003BB58666
MCADRVRAVRWALSGRARIAARGLLPAGVLPAGACRAGHLGHVQADFTLTVLGGTAAVASLYRGAVDHAAARRASDRTVGGALGRRPRPL